MNTEQVRARALLQEYLSVSADEQCRAQYDQHTAFMLGGALAMLSHLLGLYGSSSHPDSARRMFDDWRAERTQRLTAEFKRLGIEASTHLADDSGREWQQGYDLKAQALALFDAHPELHEQMREIASGFLWVLGHERPRQ